MAKSSKVNICPNCGANNSNNEVCEYCGSRISIESKQSKTTTKKSGKEEEKKEEERELQEFIDEHPFLGNMILRQGLDYIINKYKQIEEMLISRGEIGTGREKNIKICCQLEIWDANNDGSYRYAINVFDYNFYSDVYIIAENDSKELGKIYTANMPNFNILSANRVIEDIKKHNISCTFDISRYTIFCRKRLVNIGVARVLVWLFEALGIDEQNIRYHFWSPEYRECDDCFDADGNLMENPELPSLRIFGRANETSLAQHTENENVSVWIYVVWFIMTGGSIIYGCVAIYEDWASVKEIIMFILGIIGLVVGLKAIAKNSNE